MNRAMLGAVAMLIVGIFWCKPAPCEGEVLTATSSRSDELAEWVRQRNKLLNGYWVVDSGHCDSGNGLGDRPLSALQRHCELLYAPGWESDDNVAAFAVLVGKRALPRLSEADVKRVQSLFPEARLRTFEDAYKEEARNPCYCVFQNREQHTSEIRLQLRQK